MSKETKRGNSRGRIFCLVLYPENDIHNEVIKLLQGKYNILGICHDRDVYEEDNEETGTKKGDIKKCHHHIIVKFENARNLNALAKELNCESNLIQKVDSFEGMCKYLLHKDYPQKTQYQKCELYGNLIDYAMKYIDKTDPDIQLMEIIDYLENYNSLLPLPMFMRWICTHGYSGTYRKFTSTIKDLYYYYQGKYLASESR